MTAPDYSSFKDIDVTLDGGVLLITLNGRKKTKFGNNFAEEFIQTFDTADRDDRVRVIVVTADTASPVYCNGSDISGGWGDLFSAEDDKEGHSAHRDMGGKITIAVYRCRKITIAAVNGHGAGMGLTAMQLPFDFRFAWAGAKFNWAFVRRGISADGNSTFLLPRLIGQSRANSLLISGALVSPPSPLISDLYHEILPQREAVLPAALALAKDLEVNASQIAVTYTKGLLQHPGESLEENHVLESRAIRMLGAGKDAAEALNALKERRKPKYTETLSQVTSSWYPWWTTTDVRHRKAKL